MQHFNFEERMPESFELYMIGDTHLGNRSFRVKLFQKCLRSVKARKNAYIGLGGDLVDAIAPNDKRFDVDSTVPKQVRVTRQRDAIVDLLDPVADRVLYGLDGNHEYKLHNLMDITSDILDKLDVYYNFPENKDTGEEAGERPAFGTYSAKVDFGVLKVFDWHGWGVCNSRAGDQHQREMNEEIWIKRKMRDSAADCEVSCMHHIHRNRIHPPSSQLLLISDKTGTLQSTYSKPHRIPIYDDNGDDTGNYYIHEEQRWYASSGSFLGGLAEGYSPYSERFGYPPTDMGCVKLIVKSGVFKGVEKVIFK